MSMSMKAMHMNLRVWSTYVPDDSVVDTESSMSDGLGLGDEQYDDKDGDYVMETNLKSDEEFEIEPAKVQHSCTKKASAVCFFIMSDYTTSNTFFL